MSSCCYWQDSHGRPNNEVVGFTRGREEWWRSNGDEVLHDYECGSRDHYHVRPPELLKDEGMTSCGAVVVDAFEPENEADDTFSHF